MRALLHVAAMLLLLPQLFVAAAIGALDQATSGANLIEFFRRVLVMLYALLTWAGLAMIVGLVLLFAAGFHEKTRPIASAIVVLLAIGSALYIVSQDVLASWTDVFWFVPGLIAMAIGVRSSFPAVAVHFRSPTPS